MPVLAIARIVSHLSPDLSISNHKVGRSRTCHLMGLCDSKIGKACNSEFIHSLYMKLYGFIYRNIHPFNSEMI